MIAEVSGLDKPAFKAKMIFFDSFTDGREITLIIEERVVPRPNAGRTGLVLLVSPQAGKRRLADSARDRPADCIS
jgi:hypothetical protein